MKFSIEIELGLVQTLRDLKQWIKEQICKRNGHIWVVYKETESFFPLSLSSIWYDRMMELGKITHECKRCGEYKRDPYVPDNKPLKIKRYSKLSVKKTKKSK